MSKTRDPKGRISDKDLAKGRKSIKTTDPKRRTPDRKVGKGSLKKIYGF